MILSFKEHELKTKIGCNLLHGIFVEKVLLEKYKYYAVSKIYKDKDIVGYRVLINDYTSIKKDVASSLKKVLIPKSESVKLCRFDPK